MHSTDELFRLVKSLSGNEKRYFRLQAGLQQGDKTYLSLFDHLERETVYDEPRFRERHRQKDFSGNLAWRKHHLFGQLLRSLESYHSSADSNVYSLIHRAEILYDKSLYQPALKALGKAKKQASLHESFALLLEILRWEEIIAIKLSDARRQERVAREMEQTAKLLINAMEYKSMLNTIYNLHHRIGFFRQKKDERPLAVLLKDRKWKREEEALSWKAKRYYYYSHFLYSFMKGDLAAGLEFSRKNAESFFSNPGHITYNVPVYINAVNSLLYVCSATGRHEAMLHYIQKFRSTRSYFQSSQRGSAILLSYHELDYYSVAGKIQDGFIAAKRIEKELHEHADALSSLERAGLFINLAMMYFLNGKYRETIAALNRAMYEPVLDSRIDMDGMVRIFNIIVHYERLSAGKPVDGRNTGRVFLRSLVRSAYRRLSGRRGLHRFENIILDFIRTQLIRVKSDEQLVPALVKLRARLQKLKKDPYESRPLEYFDLIAWLTSRIEGRSFAEVVREKK